MGSVHPGCRLFQTDQGSAPGAHQAPGDSNKGRVPAICRPVPARALLAHLKPSQHLTDEGTEGPGGKGRARDHTARRAEPGHGPRSGSLSVILHWRSRDGGPTPWQVLAGHGHRGNRPAGARPPSTPTPPPGAAHASPGCLRLYTSFYSTNFDQSLRSISSSLLNCPALSAAAGARAGGSGGQCPRSWGDGSTLTAKCFPWIACLPLTTTL